MRRAFALTLLALLAGCASDDQWTFAFSRHVYEDASWEPKADRESEPGQESMEALGALVLLALPLALDIVCLPVTLPHDLVVLN